MFCHVSSEQVLGIHDVSSVYHVPLLLQSQGVIEYLTRRLHLDELRSTPAPSLPKEIVSSNGVTVNGNMAKIWEARAEKGRQLGQKWRELTSGYVPPLSLKHRPLTRSFHQAGAPV